MKKDSLWTQKALAAAQQAQQLNDKLPEVHATLGSVYRATGKYSEAVAELKRALSLAPNSDDTLPTARICLPEKWEWPSSD